MQRISYNLLLMSLCLLSFFVFEAHQTADIHAPIAGVSEFIPKSERPSGGITMIFTPTIAYIAWDENSQDMYVNLVYVPVFWERRVYLYEGFCTEPKCIASIANMFPGRRSSKLFPEVRIRRYHMSWDPQGEYQHAGFWGLDPN